MATNTQTPRHKLTIIEDELILELASVIVADGGGTGVPGEGDMLSSTYDPQGIEGDAFDMANMIEGADAKVLTAAERASIATLGTASTREADQDLRTTDNVEFDTVTADTVNLHAASFDPTNGGPTNLAEMAWDSVDGTLDIMADGGVKIAVGEDGMIRVRNTSGATIAKGAPLVYAGTTGASGKLEVSPWIGANVTNVRTFLGFAAGEMANNTDGYAVWFGKIKEIDTDGGAESWNDGDIIYAIPGASATLSNIRPTSGEFVTAAVVINAGSGTSGSIFVRPTFDSVSSVSGVSYGDLDDAGTVDLPTVNGPLATALGLKADASSLATVATSGSYSDLSGTPTLATVATSGDYGDLLNQPSLVVNFGGLGDATTVDLPTVNTPLATALAGKAATSHTHVVADITDFPSLANIATSGSWNDLSDVPTTFTPSAHTHVVADITDFPTLALVATSGAYADLTGTPSLATVATSGSYSDLTGTPTIPSGTQVEEYLVDDGIHTIFSLGGSATPDAANGRSQKFELTENATLNTPNNLADGQSMLITVQQGAGPFSLSFSGYVFMGSGVATDILGLATGEYAWLSISCHGPDYLIAITTEA